MVVKYLQKWRKQARKRCYFIWHVGHFPWRLSAIDLINWGLVYWKSLNATWVKACHASIWKSIPHCKIKLNDALRYNAFTEWQRFTSSTTSGQEISDISNCKLTTWNLHNIQWSRFGFDQKATDNYFNGVLNPSLSKFCEWFAGRIVTSSHKDMYALRRYSQ